MNTVRLDECWKPQLFVCKYKLTTKRKCYTSTTRHLYICPLFFITYKQKKMRHMQVAFKLFCLLYKCCTQPRQQIVNVFTNKPSIRLLCQLLKRPSNYYFFVWPGDCWLHKRLGKRLATNFVYTLYIATYILLDQNAIPQQVLLWILVTTPLLDSRFRHPCDMTLRRFRQLLFHAEQAPAGHLLFAPSSSPAQKTYKVPIIVTSSPHDYSPSIWHAKNVLVAGVKTSC